MSKHHGTSVKEKEPEAPPEEKVENLPAERSERSTALATTDFGDDAGAGLEDVQSDELRIPFLYSLKSNSPAVANPPGQGGLPGAKAGMIVNTGTGELLNADGKGVCFVPVYRDHNYVEFTPRNLGGGFVAIYEPDDPKVLELRAKQGKFGKLFTGSKRDDKGLPLDGTEVTETYYLYGLLVDEESMSTTRVIVPFASTQIKKYQSFMNRQPSFKYENPRSTAENPLPPVQPPIWAHRWRLGTTFEKNKKGDFYGWTLGLWARKPDGSEENYRKSFIPTNDPLYKEAAEFYRMLKEGTARADYGKAQDAGAEDDGAPM